MLVMFIPMNTFFEKHSYEHLIACLGVSYRIFLNSTNHYLSFLLSIALSLSISSHQGQRNKESASCNEKKKSSFNSLKCDTRALNVRDGQNYCGANQYKRNQATDCLNSRILWSPSAEQNKEVNCLEGGKLIMVVGLLPCIQKIGWCVN